MIPVRENSEVVIKFTQQQPWARWDRAQPQMGSMLTADIGTWWPGCIHLAPQSGRNLGPNSKTCQLNSHMDLENGHPWQYLDLDEWMHNINWTTTYPSINPCIHKPLHVSFHLYKERHEENLLMLLGNTLGWGQLITARPRLVSASQHLAVVPQIPQCLG